MVSENVKDFIKDSLASNEKTFKLIELIED